MNVRTLQLAIEQYIPYSHTVNRFRATEVDYDRRTPNDHRIFSSAADKGVYNEKVAALTKDSLLQGGR